MLLCGVLTLLPVVVDEVMTVLNMGSYMSYALRFGFLNAAYMLGGACLALDGICYELHKDRTGKELKPIIRINEKSQTDYEAEIVTEQTIQKKKTLIGGSMVWFVVFAIVFLAAFIFLLWWSSDKNYQVFLRAITDNSEILNGIEGFAGKFAHSLGGKYGTPHGLANAVIMPYVLEAYGSHAYKKLHRLGIAAGVCSETDSCEVGAKKFIAAVKALNSRMNIPTKLSGVVEADIPEMAAHAEREANPLYPVPKLMTKEELKQFYYSVADWGKV